MKFIRGGTEMKISHMGVWKVEMRLRESYTIAYERSGDVLNVVFPVGGFIREHELWMYYGAADSCVCLAKARIDDVLKSISSI